MRWNHLNQKDADRLHTHTQYKRNQTRSNDIDQTAISIGNVGSIRLHSLTWISVWKYSDLILIPFVNLKCPKCSRISIQSQLNCVHFLSCVSICKKNNENSRRCVVTYYYYYYYRWRYANETIVLRFQSQWNKDLSWSFERTTFNAICALLLNVAFRIRGHTLEYIIPKTGNIYFVRLFVIDCLKSILYATHSGTAHTTHTQSNIIITFLAIWYL